MDTPGVSLFQGADINISNSRNEEEEEDLEDQRRRNEELQNILIAKLDDFNFDESTVNSSIISAISVDNDQSKYLEASTQNEQLKVLYEVRCRELQALRQEHKTATATLNSEINTLKKKLLLTEAELEQIKVSFKNCEELLVEKTQIVKDLSSVLERKEKQIDDYIKNTEDLHLEIATYKSTIDGLHLQLQGDRNPLGNPNKQYKSEELKKAHQDQIIRLESLLDEKTRYAKLTEKENVSLKGELNKLIDTNTENSKLINTLTTNFESAQKQCQDLINVIETVSNENKHLQDRINNIYNQSPTKRSSLDYNSLLSHVDKLKKMLVDKSVQINTLHAKLQNYEENHKELLEYRKLKTDAHQKEFQQCENEEHTKNLILMQNNLQNYKRIIDDKNQQILHLNSTNKELFAKMEETMFQTRNDIQQFSDKYRVPQLQQMTEDLKAAQNYIAELEEKLKTSMETLSFVQKEAKKVEILKEELKDLKVLTEKERNNFENEIKKLQCELEVSLTEIKNLKHHIEELVTENSKLQSQLKNIDNGDECLKKQYFECVQAFHKSEKKIRELEERLEEITKLKNAAEEKCCASEYEAKDTKTELVNLEKQLSDIKILLDNASEDVKGKEEIIRQLQNTIKDLRKELNKISEETKKNKKDSSCQTEFKECGSEKKIRRNLELELKEVEELDRGKEATLICLELKLREEIQKEYVTKLEAIEEYYKKACNPSRDLVKEYNEKLKTQDTKLRKYSAMILSECTAKIKEFENNREELLKKLYILQNNFDEYKSYSAKREDHFIKLIKDLQLNNKKDAEKWKLWSQKLVNNCLKIEATNKKTRDNILYKMKRFDENVSTIEKTYEKAKKKLDKK